MESLVLYAFYLGDRYEGANIVDIYFNKNNAIKSAMRHAYRELDINACKMTDDWVWYDEQNLIAVREIYVKDSKDLQGDSLFPAFLQYKEYLEAIPVKDLEQMRKGAVNRKKLAQALRKRKPVNKPTKWNYDGVKFVPEKTK